MGKADTSVQGRGPDDVGEQAKRTDEALEKLLAAGSELLIERGADGFTLREVSSRAGVSYGSMHWRFDNKEALLNAVHDRLNQRLLKHLESFDRSEPWQDLDVFQATERAVRRIAAAYEEDPALLRALSLHSTIAPHLTARAARTVHRGGEAFRSVLAPPLAANGDPTPDVTADSIFTVIGGSMTARVTWPEYQTTPEMTWERLVDDLCVMAVAFVRASLPGSQSAV